MTKSALVVTVCCALLLSCNNSNTPASHKQSVTDSTAPAIDKVIAHADSIAANGLDSVSKKDILFEGKPILTIQKKDMDWLLKRADSVTDRNTDAGEYEKAYWIRYCTFSYDGEDLVDMDIYHKLSITVKGKTISIGGSAASIKSLFPNSFALQDPPKDGMAYVNVSVYDIPGFSLSFGLDLTGKVLEIDVSSED